MRQLEIVPILLAGAFGIGIGGVTFVFFWLIEFASGVMFGASSGQLFIEAATTLHWWHYLLITTGGGILTSCILWWFRDEKLRGEGVPEVLDTLEYRNGTFSPQTAPAKLLLSVVSISSGGAGGKEGPIALIGAACSGLIPNRWRQKQLSTRTLATFGAAAGIAASFGAPVAAALFAFELLRLSVRVQTIVLIGLTSLTASLSMQWFYGGAPFELQAMPPNPYELSFWVAGSIVLVLCLCIGLGFIQVLSMIERGLQKLPLPFYVLPVIGGVGVGLIGMHIPEVADLGGVAVLKGAGELTMLTILLLILTKTIAASITIGSNNAGGLLGPSLYMGNLIGALSVTLVAVFWTGMPLAPETIGIIAIAAFFGAVSQAPLFAAFLMTEVTGEWEFIFPTMGFALLSAWLFRKCTSKTIFKRQPDNLFQANTKSDFKTQPEQAALPKIMNISAR